MIRLNVTNLFRNSLMLCFPMHWKRTPGTKAHRDGIMEYNICSTLLRKKKPPPRMQMNIFRN